MRGRYSLRMLLAIVGLLCASLALTQFNYLIGSGVMIAFVLAVAIVGRNSFRQRGLVYGSVGGFALCVTAAIVVAVARGELPEFRSTEPHVTLDLARQYAVPIGGFLGGLSGYLFATLRARRPAN